MRIIKPLGYTFLALCAAFGLYSGFVKAKGWVNDYRQQRAQTVAMWAYLSETVGTRTEGNEQKPMNRADALAFIVTQAIEQAKAKPPVGK